MKPTTKPSRKTNGHPHRGFSSHKVTYAAQGCQRGVIAGGAPAVLAHARSLGLAKIIDSRVSVLKVERGYRESDHVIALALSHC